MNSHQIYGVVVALAGLCATLCGFRVLEPPKEMREATVDRLKWVGPLAFLFGVFYIFLRARS